MKKFEEASVIHLPKLHADHRPVLVRIGRTKNKKGEIKPFRFLVAWLMNETITNFVASHWLSDSNHFQAVKSFIRDLKD